MRAFFGASFWSERIWNNFISFFDDDYMHISFLKGFFQVNLIWDGNFECLRIPWIFLLTLSYFNKHIGKYCEISLRLKLRLEWLWCGVHFKASTLMWMIKYALATYYVLLGIRWRTKWKLLNIPRISLLGPTMGIRAGLASSVRAIFYENAKNVVTETQQRKWQKENFSMPLRFN